MSDGALEDGPLLRFGFKPVLRFVFVSLVSAATHLRTKVLWGSFLNPF